MFKTLRVKSKIDKDKFDPITGQPGLELMKPVYIGEGQFAGRYNPGQEFNCSEADAKRLLADKSCEEV